MRLVSLHASGFRGLVRDITLDIDGDVVLVHGGNGTGKTSLMDAVFWCLVGEIPRFGTARRDVVSLYSESGQANVELVLGQGAERLRASRTASDGTERFVVETAAGRVEGAAAGA